MLHFVTSWWIQENSFLKVHCLGPDVKHAKCIKLIVNEMHTY